MLASAGPKAFATLGVAALVIAGAAPASAYCRSTTCKDSEAAECARDAEGCKLTGLPLFWRSNCVGISLQESSSVHIPFKYFEQAAQAAMLEWTDLQCDTGVASIAFSQLDEVACHKAEYNLNGTNANIILFQDNKWEYEGIENNLAKTTVSFSTETGEILDADIELNHAYNHFTINDMVVEYDVQAILTHEIGHLIGLDHSADPFSTMYADYEVGSLEQRSLEADDILAVCEAYPPGREATCHPEPQGGLGDECGGVEPEGEAGGPIGCGVGERRKPGFGIEPWSFSILLAALAVAARARFRIVARTCSGGREGEL